MEKTLQVLNEMVEEGVILPYAIGGAIAATRYIEPIQTYSLDIFVVFSQTDTLLISLKPIYRYLKKRGYEPFEGHIEIEGWPVQFLPVFNSLTEEAVREAVEVRFGATQTRIMRAEHLAAIMLETGRAKDRSRLLQFIEMEVLPMDSFLEIIDRLHLQEKWQDFLKRHA